MISRACGTEISKYNDLEVLKRDPVHHDDWFESGNLLGRDS